MLSSNKYWRYPGFDWTIVLLLFAVSWSTYISTSYMKLKQQVNLSEIAQRAIAGVHHAGHQATKHLLLGLRGVHQIHALVEEAHRDGHRRGHDLQRPHFVWTMGGGEPINIKLACGVMDKAYLCWPRRSPSWWRPRGVSRPSEQLSGRHARHDKFCNIHA